MSKRRDLESLRTRLGALESSAPDAERFHQQRQALVRELAGVLKGPLGVFVMGALRVEEIRARLTEFEEDLVPLLTVLQATLTEVAVAVTEISTTRLADSRVSTSAADWGARYQRDATRCLSIVTSVAEAELTQRELNEIREKVLALQGVVGLFVETEALLRRWQPKGDLKADVVDRDFDEQWVPTFVADGATAALSHTMETGLAPLRELDTVVETAPVSTAQTDRINAAIEDLRRWCEDGSGVVDVSADEVQSFRARALQVATEEGGMSVDELVTELTERILRVQQQVQDRTKVWLAELTADTENFRCVCPDVDVPLGGDDRDGVAQLTEIDRTTPDGYADWKGVFDRARDELSRVATTRRSELAEALNARVKEARDRLEPADASQPFPPDVEVRVAGMQEALGTVLVECAAEPIGGLRELARMEGLIAEILRDYGQAWEELIAQCAEAEDRHEDLMGLLGQVNHEDGLDVRALRDTLSTAWEQLPPGGLEFSARGEDATRRSTLVDDHVGRALTVMQPEVVRLRNWIRNLPEGVVAERTTTAEDVDDLSLADVVNELQVLQGERANAGMVLHGRRCAYVGRLTDLPREMATRLDGVPGLTAEDRREADELVAAIDHANDAGLLTEEQPEATDEIEALVGVLETLKSIVGRYDRLARRLWGDEQEARRLLDELQGTLRQCADQGLQAWHADRWRRYSACVEGACGGHVGWAVARRQLEDTRSDIERLRVECHRIVAARIMRQCAVVEGAITRTEQSERRREMVETLEAVEADGVQGRLVSPEVRTRLADLAVAVTGVRND